MREIGGVRVWGDPDEATLAQAKRCAAAGDTAGTCLMADAHRGYSMPIGGVVAYRNAISPSGVGYDIACGIMAVATDCMVDAVKRELPGVLDEIDRRVSFGLGRVNAQPIDHELFDDPLWVDERDTIGRLKDRAAAQLGTVGSGNHFVDLLEEQGDTPRLWIAAHFGSRGFGHGVASGFLNLAAGRGFFDRAPGESMDQEPTLLPLASGAGQAYLRAMQLAGRYAYAGREHVVRTVLDILGASAVKVVHNHHNYCIAGSAFIPTTNGPKRMDELRVGDTIYAFDEERGLVEAPVTAHRRTGHEPIFRISTANRTLRVSGSHPVLTVQSSQEVHPTRLWHTRGVGRYVWKRADTVVLGDILVCAEGYYPQDADVAQPLPTRLVGAFAGDGWTRNPEATKRSGYGIGLAIGGPDEPHADRYRALLQSALPAEWKNNGPGAFGLTASSVVAYHTLEASGITGTAGEKRLPPWVFRLPRGEKLELLSGYLDADGSVAASTTSNHGRATIASVNEGLVRGLREIAIACGLRITSVRREQRQTNCGPATVFRCVLDADGTVRFDLWNERTAVCQRRTSMRRHHPQGLEPVKLGYLVLPAGAFGQRVRSVVVEDTEDVYDLTVGHPGHAFVCEGVVVHNCWQESHNGETVWVVRKGATPAFPGQEGFVGGSMADIAAVVEGIDTPENLLALRSTVHGAGRIMSRSAARGNRKGTRKGVVTRQMMAERAHAFGVLVRGGDVDESPHVYRPLADVLAEHAGTLRINHLLRPIGVVMAGADVRDPFKD